MNCWSKPISSILGILLIAAAAQAQDIDLVGQTGWYFSGRRLAMYADRVESHRNSMSGSLYLRMRATTNAPSGGDFGESTLIGSLAVGRLAGNEAIYNLFGRAYYAPPVPGLYFTSMTLEEFSNGAYHVLDYEDLDGIVNFGAWGQGSAEGSGSNGDLNFTGPVSWTAENGRVLLSASEIVNDRSTRSGALRLRLWATTEPYAGGALQGFPLATKALGRLRPGYEFQDYSRLAPFRLPPDEGTYYTVLTLEEFYRGRWTLVDFVAFPETSFF